MSRYLSTLSAVLFYLLGGSFFLAYLLLRNGIGGAWPETWLSSADLPLLLVGLLFGGTSVYRSLLDEDDHSTTLAITITVPLLAIFALGLALNFWGASAAV